MTRPQSMQHCRVPARSAVVHGAADSGSRRDADGPRWTSTGVVPAEGASTALRTVVARRAVTVSATAPAATARATAVPTATARATAVPAPSATESTAPTTVVTALTRVAPARTAVVLTRSRPTAASVTATDSTPATTRAATESAEVTGRVQTEAPGSGWLVRRAGARFAPHPRTISAALRAGSADDCRSAVRSAGRRSAGGTKPVA